MFGLQWKPLGNMSAEVVRAKFLSLCVYCASICVFVLSATQITHVPAIIFNALAITYFVPRMVEYWIKQRSVCPIELVIAIFWFIGLLHGLGLLNWLVMPDGLITRNWVNLMESI